MTAAVRLVVTDLDRTILRLDATASVRTQAAIARTLSRGVPVVICTARSARSAIPLARSLGLTEGYVICGSGSTVFNLTNDLLVSRHPMPSELAWELVQRVRDRIPGASFSAECEEEYFREEGYQSTLLPPLDAQVEDASVFTRRGPEVSKVNVRHDALGDEELCAAVLATVDELGLSSVISAAGFVEVLGAGVDKGSGTAWVAERIEVDQADVVAFGDDLPDLPMIRWSGRGVAVADAHPELLSAADEVCGRHDDDGVAAILESL